MAPLQTFGGDWTEQKLDRLGKYLLAYRKIFSANRRARFFETWYVDAFAGTGERSEGDDPEELEYRQGSALRALALADPFDHYLFIEKSADRLAELRRNVEERAADRLPRCTFRCGDANEELQQWKSQRDWHRERAVVFLDPFGAQVNWSTVQLLGTTRAIDLWYLFPLSAVLRLLKRQGDIPESWRARLTELFGEARWEQAFFEPARQQSLFDGGASVERTATPESVCAYLQRRLADVFPHVSDVQLVLNNSKNSPMFSLCFASANQTAVRIARDILGKSGR